MNNLKSKLNLSDNDINYSDSCRGKTKNIDIFQENLFFNKETYLWQLNSENNNKHLNIGAILYIPSNFLIDNYWHFFVENLFMISNIFNKYKLDKNASIMIDLKFQPVYSYANHCIDISNVSKIIGIEHLEKFIGSKEKIFWINSEKKEGIYNNIYTNYLIKGTGGLNEPMWNFNEPKYIDNWSFLRNRLIKNYEISECIEKTNNILFINRNSSSNKKVINYEELLNKINELIKNTNYKLINIDFAKITVYEQIKYINQADIVICSRGAAMAKALFLKKNAIFMFCKPYGKQLDPHPDTLFLVPFIPNYYKIIDCNCILNWGNWKDNEYNTNNFIFCLSNIIKSIDN